MKYIIYLITILITTQLLSQTTYVVDAVSKTPVSFATISFGDGRGTFAGDVGEFTFISSKYKDIDSLYISAIGFKEQAFAAASLPKKIFLAPEASLLSEVIVTAEKKGKYKKKKHKETTHTNYYNCWLPTVESEVAVLFNREDGKSSKIAQLWIPINSEKEYRKKGNMKFSTLFRIQFYKNENGLPGTPVIHRDIVFRVSEQDDEMYELDIDKYQIFIPRDGIFASLQVLGYADKEGKLIQTKKYNEIETPRGIQKVSVTFRPLLPFTSELPSQKTYVRRVFFNDKKWQVFDRTYNEHSALVKTGNVNYGMGALLHIYQE
ncbi:3-ketoacyl-ACP reductase [Dokdonia sp. Dokd-P16]|uniref:3-ketoacyl-ACP reductase n=1 Tax=Dokdonia sp. Dokd-P16 TaxID=2173169 RepID=UPI000D544E39|nr:3-ketoacyl-ACP reductase [Dokdonia sp. Dokd-P16]AWH73555.1 3-ketoacyl-ACP reductase [Dokdonia sp. Dokd-P16]